MSLGPHTVNHCCQRNLTTNVEDEDHHYQASRRVPCQQGLSHAAAFWMRRKLQTAQA